MLWGGPANEIQIINSIKEEDCIKILRSSHPSNLGKNKSLQKTIHSFTDPDYNHFKECNEYLKSKGEKEINWHT